MFWNKLTLEDVGHPKVLKGVLKTLLGVTRSKLFSEL